MLFNSLEFLLFLPIVFTLYWLVNRLTAAKGGLATQNLLLLIASYVFYGWWDWRFLSLIAFSTVVDWFVGLRIHHANQHDHPNDANHRSKRGKRWLWASLVVNLGLLGYFKYANFFIDSWVNAWGSLGIPMHVQSLQLILPVGISFYTFQTLSYSIDIYRRQLKPTTSLLNFAAFVSFFPQLVAGPIERASALLPQIERRRTFDYNLAVSGLRLILWGMFKKVVVADTCAFYVDDIFANHQDHSGPTLALGGIYFAFQIYGDFSGYSDIAIGTARLFGIRLMTNFQMPYFSRDIAEFWRRWHISLSTWFRDYLYIPLGGSRNGKWNAVRNTFLIFLISGFWHGSNWTFVLWGFIHALLFLPLLILGLNRRNTGNIMRKSWIPLRSELFGMGLTFFFVTFAWIFFRAPNVNVAFAYVQGVFLNWPLPTMVSKTSLLWIGVLVSCEWLHLLDSFRQWFFSGRWEACSIRWFGYSLVLWLIMKNLQSQAEFIYFQF